MSVSLVVAVAAAATLVGCGGSPAVATPVDARGKVLLQGKAPTETCVVFTAAGKPESFCKLGPGGDFAVKLVPGRYQVGLEPIWKRTASSPRPTTIPTKYQDPNQSQIEIEIPSGGADGLEIKFP